MKRDKGFLNRMSLTAFAVLSQMFWMAVFILQLSEYYMFANIALVVLSLFVVVYIINGRSNPAVKLAWIVPIMIFPLFGGLAYLFFGMIGFNFIIELIVNLALATVINRIIVIGSKKRR